MVYATQIRQKGANETRHVAVSYADKLESGELLTGSVTLTDSTGDLTISYGAVTSSTETINGLSVGAGAAITFTCSGGTAGITYTVKIQVATDASNPQSFDDNIQIEVV